MCSVSLRTLSNGLKAVMFRNFCRRTAAIFSILGVFAPGSSYAQITGYAGGSTSTYCMASDTANTPAGAGPWVQASQSGANVNVTWGGDGWNKWHFSWSQNGKAGKSYEYGSGQKSFTFKNVGACQHFGLSIQGCVKHYLGKDRCSAFAQSTFTSAGSDICASGYVWREAYPNDHVCVLTAVRTQAAADNARHQLAPCPAPLVPRLARANDNVCVAAEVAKDVRGDNEAVCSRLAKCP
jgi:hypothetical protein